jgi:hypothetical protein
MVVWPQAADIIVARRSTAEGVTEEASSLEWAGIDRPLTDAEVREIDSILGLEEVPA